MKMYMMMVKRVNMMKVTKTKAGALRCGPFSTEDTLRSYLRMCTPPVMITTKHKRWVVASRESIDSTTRRWKRSTKETAHIEMCDWVADHSRKKVA